MASTRYCSASSIHVTDSGHGTRATTPTAPTYIPTEPDEGALEQTIERVFSNSSFGAGIRCLPSRSNTGHRSAYRVVAVQEDKEEHEKEDRTPEKERNGSSLNHGDAKISARDGASQIIELEETKRGSIVLVGCFMVAFTCMGFGLSWGALQAFLVTDTLKGTDPSIVSLIGALLSAISVMFSPITGRLGDRYGYRPIIFVGAVLGVVGLCLGAISTKLWQLFLSIGVLFGLCQACIVPLILSLPTQWFFKHRGLATGLAGGAAGLGGAMNSVLTRVMVAHFGGIKETLFIYAGYFGIFWIIALLLLKENRIIPFHEERRLKRLSQAQSDAGVVYYRGDEQDNESRSLKVDSKEPALTSQKPRPEQKQETLEAQPVLQPPHAMTLKKVIRSSVFISLTAGILISTFGYFPPLSYISTYTQEVIEPYMSSTNSLTATWPLFGANIGVFIGRMSGGQVVDKIFGPIQTLMIFLGIGGLLQMIAWHFATNYTGVIAFATVYGFFGGAATSLIPVVIGQLFGVGPSFAATVGLTLMATFPGSLAGNPISGLVKEATGTWLAFQLFSGAMQFAGAVILAWAWYKGVGPGFGK